MALAFNPEAPRLALPHIPQNVLHVAQNLVTNHGVHPTLALASAAKAAIAHPTLSMNATQATAPRPLTSTGGGVTGPYVPPGGINPYTGKRLGSNEYVGVAGSEADHPGMVRIPPPGWNNPASPFYERRDYVIGPKGQIVAAEPGFNAGAGHPLDTGRIGEINSEHQNEPGWQRVHMSEPGVTQWNAGDQNPNGAPMPWQQPASLQGLPQWLIDWFASLRR